MRRDIESCFIYEGSVTGSNQRPSLLTSLVSINNTSTSCTGFSALRVFYLKSRHIDNAMRKTTNKRIVRIEYSSRRVPFSLRRWMFLFVPVLLGGLSEMAVGFMLPPRLGTNHSGGKRATRLWTTLPEASQMRVKELREELESYGLSTRQFLEKSELIQAVLNARKEGKKPINGGKSAASSSSYSYSKSANNAQQQQTSASSFSSNTQAKKQKSKQEQKAKIQKLAESMKVPDLKKALNSNGISTASFFEKSEFIKAYVDLKLKSDDDNDPDYRDVVMQKLQKGDPRVLTGKIIDVTPNP